ncbi:MAG: hypothetical protein WCK20_03160 [Thermoleophilia bacterium]
MRALVATLVALVVLAGSAVAVAQRADTSGAARARMIAALSSEATPGSCGCTASTRAKDRVASRATTDASTTK